MIKFADFQKKRICFLILSLILAFGFSSCETQKAKPKIPHKGGNVTPRQAYKMLKQGPEHTFLIDCRSMAEYELVGHPPMAYNIPYKLWTTSGFKLNPDFAQDVAEKFKKSDRLLLLCRSGKRSCYASNKLAEAGFKQVFNVLSGFEGDKVKKSNSAHFGHRRRINGWQHDGLPYTYKLDDDFIYKFHFPCRECE